STTGVKEPHITDAALQYYVITNSGLKLADISIVHLNNKYIRKGELDVQQLFHAASILKEVKELQPYITTKAVELKKLLKQKTVPVIETGKHCEKPYPCDFYGFCSKNLLEEDLVPEKKYINKPVIKEFLEQLKYPLQFLDFETWMTAVPEQDGHWPYRQVCFQYSVHSQKKQNAELEQLSYLAESTASTSLEFLENLIQAVGKNGSILVYNQTFEITRLKELKKDHPKHAKAIDSIIDRIVDLMPPFRKNYRLPAMQGKYSIKNVLPALVPELSYEGMIIGSGGVASAAFYNLKNVEDETEKGKTRNALLEYCGLDTLAMVKILEKLELSH
ncbi:MAG: DUF2779 domain-containing protein, partial [Aquaticitalea sp.]